jgi:hypothetical protein
MGREELDNLVRIRKLKPEPASRKEFSGMVESARRRLADAQNESLDPDSQFDLAYGAAHRLACVELAPIQKRIDTLQVAGRNRHVE